MASCLADLDARSLRSLKAVSRAWQRRARRMLGDTSSPWRRAPEWSAGAWAQGWFAERLRSEDPMVRKRGLLGLDALEATVELPTFLSDLLARISPDESSSARTLAIRALARCEALTLAPHTAQLEAALASSLLPHEAATDATALLRAKMRAAEGGGGGGGKGGGEGGGAGGSEGVGEGVGKGVGGGMGDDAGQSEGEQPKRSSWRRRGAKKRSREMPAPLPPNDLRYWLGAQAGGPASAY